MPVQLDDEDDLTDPFDTLFDKLTQKSKTAHSTIHTRMGCGC
jgi:hypothetical protein